MKYKQTHQKKNEIESMVQAGYPECFGVGHCNCCIRSYRRQLEKFEEDDMCPNCITPWKCNGPHTVDN